MKKAKKAKKATKKVAQPKFRHLFDASVSSPRYTLLEDGKFIVPAGDYILNGVYPLTVQEGEVVEFLSGDFLERE